MNRKLTKLCLMWLCCMNAPEGVLQLSTRQGAVRREEGMLPLAKTEREQISRQEIQLQLLQELRQDGVEVDGGPWDIENDASLSGMLGHGALWSKGLDGLILNWTNPLTSVFDKDAKVLSSDGYPHNRITNPFAFNSPEDIRSLAAKLGNGGALPNAYLVFFKLDLTTLLQLFRSGNYLSILYFDPRGFFFSRNQNNLIPKDDVIDSYCIRNPRGFNSSNPYNSLELLQQSVGKHLPPSSKKIPRHVMNQLMERHALYAYRISDTEAFTLLSLKSDYSCVDEVRTKLQSMTEEAIEEQSSVSYGSLTIEGNTLYVCLLPGPNLGESYLYVTPDKPKDEVFQWERVPVITNPAWTSNPNITRKLEEDNKFAVWCAKGMNDPEWKLDPAEKSEFFKFLLSGNQFFVGTPTQAFTRGVLFIRKHLEGHEPEMMQQFTEYVKEVAKYLAPTKYTVEVTQAGINSWIGFATKRLVEHEANNPEMREELAATAYPMLYLALTKPGFPQDATIKYFYTVAGAINGMMNPYRLQDATVECISELQSWSEGNFRSKQPEDAASQQMKDLQEELRQMREENADIRAQSRTMTQMMQTLLSRPMSERS